MVFPKVRHSACHQARVVPHSHALQQAHPGGQGGWESDETLEAAAARETVEEAGVRGQLEVRGHASARPHELPPLAWSG